MCDCCDPKMMALKWIVVGIILIVNQLYIKWDIWVVIGALIIIKAIIMFAMPCKCETKSSKKK